MVIVRYGKHRDSDGDGGGGKALEASNHVPTTSLQVLLLQCMEDALLQIVRSRSPSDDGPSMVTCKLGEPGAFSESPTTRCAENMVVKGGHKYKRETKRAVAKVVLR